MADRDEAFASKVQDQLTHYLSELTIGGLAPEVQSAIVQTSAYLAVSLVAGQGLAKAADALAAGPMPGQTPEVAQSQEIVMACAQCRWQGLPQQLKIVARRGVGGMMIIVVCPQCERPTVSDRDALKRGGAG